MQALGNPNILEYVATHLDFNATMGLPRLTIVTELCSGGEVRSSHVSGTKNKPLVWRARDYGTCCLCCTVAPTAPACLPFFAAATLPRRAVACCYCLPACLQLFDRIQKRGHYSEKDAAELMVKLATALQQLHSSGVVHRDLKVRRPHPAAACSCPFARPRPRVHTPAPLVLAAA